MQSLNHSKRRKTCTHTLRQLVCWPWFLYWAVSLRAILLWADRDPQFNGQIQIPTFVEVLARYCCATKASPVIVQSFEVAQRKYLCSKTQVRLGVDKNPHRRFFWEGGAALAAP